MPPIRLEAQLSSSSNDGAPFRDRDGHRDRVSERDRQSARARVRERDRGRKTERGREGETSGLAKDIAISAAPTARSAIAHAHSLQTSIPWWDWPLPGSTRENYRPVRPSEPSLPDARCSDERARSAKSKGKVAFIPATQLSETTNMSSRKQPRVIDRVSG